MTSIDQPFEPADPLDGAEAVAQAAEEVAQVLMAEVDLPDGDIPLTLILSQPPDIEVIHKPLPRTDSDYLRLALFVYSEIVVTGAPAAALLMSVRGAVPGDLPTLERARSVVAISGEKELVVINARDRHGATVERAALIERSHDAPPRYLPFLGAPSRDRSAGGERADLPLPGALDVALIGALKVAAEDGPDRQFALWLFRGGLRDQVAPVASCPCGSSKTFAECHREWYPLGLTPAN